MTPAFQSGAFQASGFQAPAAAIGSTAFQPGAFQFNGFQTASTVSTGGYGGGKAKKKYIVRKDGKLLVFKSEADALTVLSASDEPQEIEAPAAKAPKRKVVKQAEARAEEVVPLVDLEALAKRQGELEAVRAMLAQAQYNALMALVLRMQDEEDVELLLLAA